MDNSNKIALLNQLKGYIGSVKGVADIAKTNTSKLDTGKNGIPELVHIDHKLYFAIHELEEALFEIDEIIERYAK